MFLDLVKMKAPGNNEFYSKPGRAILRLNDILKGGNKDNQYHAGTPNQFAVAPLLLPPRLAWNRENPPPGPPLSYANKSEEIQTLNLEIEEFNTPNGIANVPHINLLGARRYKLWYEDGNYRQVIHHRRGQWRENEERFDKLHLNDAMRIRMAWMVQDYFVGEIQRAQRAHH